MRLGISVVGQFMGVKPDEGFGSQIRIRTGEPFTRGGELKPGREENVDFFAFSPVNGRPTLPEDLKVGDYVQCDVSARSKGYRSADRGLSGMTVFTLESIVVIDGSVETTAALRLLDEMSIGGGE